MIENLDLSEWKCFSVKPNSENYVNADKTIHLKLLSNDLVFTVNDIKKSMDAVQHIIALGIPTPKIIDLVKTTDNRMGYISEYIPSKISVSRAISKDPLNIEEYAERFGTIGKLLHTTKCDTTYFPDMTLLIQRSINNADYINETQRYYLNAVVNSVPRQDSCIHGDFQFSNIVLSNNGDYVIDLGYFGYANAIFDLGLLRFFYESLNEEAMNILFHMNRDMYKTAMRIAIKKETSLNELALDRYIHGLLPYGVCLFMYHLSNRPDDNFMKQKILQMLDKSMKECPLK